MPDPPTRTVREFLENSPLFLGTRVKVPQVIKVDDLPVPTSVTLTCPTCKKPTTWTLDPVMTTKHVNLSASALPAKDVGAPFNGGTLVSYACADCKDEKEGFWITWEPIDPETKREGVTLAYSGPTRGYSVAYASLFKVRKIGQTTVPLPQSTAALRSLLGDDYEHYRRALQCMSMGFGIGAVAYLRRVIESKTAALLDRVEVLLTAEQDTASLEKLTKARQSFSAQERLQLAADLLPRSLRPGNHNPLHILYGAFSQEIHASVSEEDAHATAERLQWALDFLVTRIEADLSEIAKFGAAIAVETNRHRGG